MLPKLSFRVLHIHVTTGITPCSKGQLNVAVNLSIISNLVSKIVIWKAQRLPQSNDAVYPMHQEEKETTQKTNKQHRITSNRNFTVMAKFHAVSSKLKQKPQSVNELLCQKHYLLCQKVRRKK